MKKLILALSVTFAAMSLVVLPASAKTVIIKKGHGMHHHGKTVIVKHR
jgi:hypothetical protein